MKAIGTIILLFFSFWAQAQIAYIFTAKDSLFVGDTLDIKLVLSGIAEKEVEEINWDTLSNLEFINMADTSNYPIDFDWDHGQFGGEDFVYSADEMGWSIDDLVVPQEVFNTFKMTVWEMCGFVIPPPIITLKNGDTLRVASKGVLVKSPLMDELGMEKAPSFGIMSIEKNVWDYLLQFWWLIVLITAIGIAFFIRNWYRNRVVPPPLTSQEEEKEKVVIPPDVVALEKLKALKKSRKWETLSEKVYVSELTDIIREYIENRFDIQALEMTSSEILQAMQGDLLNEIQLDQLRNTLNVSDMIKFAKSKADHSLHEKFVDDAIEMVETSKEKRVDHDV